ncbi:zinc finger protein 675-like [Phlebotomus papatasi]|uniref:zinc finger protein 675-like n=1 Tax=Phlebotomus papatasi TaxID=29031 RepID=UPI0024833590|nr:zinc finger protein 675-like [Phlebotomus papatasi]
MTNITLSSDKVCRLCLVKEQDVYLGDKMAKDAKYCQIVMSFTNITYSPNDGLPQSICRMCACQLKNIYIFKQRCESSHETLLANFGSQDHVEYLDEVKDIPEIKTIIMKESEDVEDQRNDDIKVEDDDNGMDYYSEPEIMDSGITVKLKETTAGGSGKRAREKRHQCSECGALVESPSKLVRHLRTHVLDNYKVKHSSQNGKIYSCKKCGRAYLKVKELRAHVVNGGCKKASSDLVVEADVESGSQHIQKNEDESLFSCTKCSFTHESAEEMIEHYRVSKSCSEEVKEKPFMCEFCQKQFQYKSCLEKHLLCHTGVKRFECDICFKKFTRNGEVAMHKKRHANIRPYVCEECGSAFGKSSDLVRHRRIHTREAPYQCIVCERRFIWDTALKVHMHSHTGERPYVCKKCPKAYSSRSGLVKHRASNHQEPEADANSGTTPPNEIKILRKSSRLAR